MPEEGENIEPNQNNSTAERVETDEERTARKLREWQEIMRNQKDRNKESVETT